MMCLAESINVSRDTTEDVAKETATSPCVSTCVAVPTSAEEDQQDPTHSPLAGTASGGVPLAEHHGSVKSASYSQPGNSAETGMLQCDSPLLPMVDACSCVCIGLTMFVVFAHTSSYTVEQYLDCLALPDYR